MNFPSLSEEDGCARHTYAILSIVCIGIAMRVVEILSPCNAPVVSALALTADFLFAIALLSICLFWSKPQSAFVHCKSSARLTAVRWGLVTVCCALLLPALARDVEACLLI